MNLPPWRLELSRQAEREIDRLPPDTRRRVLDALLGPVTNPPTGDIAKLQGQRDEYRPRLGDRRVLFRRDRDGRIVVVTAVRPRSSAYRP